MSNVEVLGTTKTNGYQLLAMIVPTDEKRFPDVEGPLAYLDTMQWLPVVYFVGLWKSIEPFKVSECWHEAAMACGYRFLAFTTSTVYPTESLIKKTIEVLTNDPSGVVVAHRIDEQEDGTFKFNPVACGDWIAMASDQYRNGAKWRQDTITGNYIEFDYLARLYVGGRPIYVLSEQVIHQYHPFSYAVGEQSDRQNSDNIGSSIANGLPRVWWRWPEDPWLEYKDHSEQMKIIRV